MESRVIFHIDFDYFFAQCEEIRTPDLKSKPVCVCVFSDRGGDSGAIATANYIARKFGVKSGIPIIFAKKRLEEREIKKLSSFLRNLTKNLTSHQYSLNLLVVSLRLTVLGEKYRISQALFRSQIRNCKEDNQSRSALILRILLIHHSTLLCLG